MTDLDDLKWLLERATPGELEFVPKSEQANVYLLWDKDGNYPEDTSYAAMHANADLFTALRNAADALIAELEAARECVEALRNLLGQVNHESEIRGEGDFETGATIKAISAYDAATEKGTT